MSRMFISRLRAAICSEHLVWEGAALKECSESNPCKPCRKPSIAILILGLLSSRWEGDSCLSKRDFLNHRKTPILRYLMTQHQHHEHAKPTPHAIVLLHASIPTPIPFRLPPSITVLTANSKQRWESVATWQLNCHDQCTCAGNNKLEDGAKPCETKGDRLVLIRPHSSSTRFLKSGSAILITATHENSDFCNLFLALTLTQSLRPRVKHISQQPPSNPPQPYCLGHPSCREHSTAQRDYAKA